MKYLNKKNIIILVALLLLAVCTGYFIKKKGTWNHGHENVFQIQDEKKVWTCSMHPHIKLPEPGLCPICNMPLIPLEGADGSDDIHDHSIYLSPYAEKLAEIRTKKVVRRPVEKEIRITGKIAFDETRVKHIAAWVPGRIDRLFIDFTGMRVNPGDHLFSIYSPELYSAQEELIQAYQHLTARRKKGSPNLIKQAENIYQAVKEKLRLWGLTSEQINKIEKQSDPEDHITIYAPTGGIIIHRDVAEGSYVKIGAKICTIADLSHVWVLLDAYESDISWLTMRQKIEFWTKAYPGEKFYGEISFIEPVLDPTTRTIKVRLKAENIDNRLKPEMYVSALAKVPLAGDGLPIPENLSGKWTCPMHPEIVNKIKGRCRLCTMALIQIKSKNDSRNFFYEYPLVIPRTAPLITGNRGMVFLAVPGKKGHYKGREIILGTRAGEYYVVKKGLMEGDEVVVNGNFKIDSSLQLLGKPSMMSIENTNAETTDSAKKNRLQTLMEAYADLHHTLSRDDFEGFKKSASNILLFLLKNTDELSAKYPAFKGWTPLLKEAKDLSNAKDIKAARNGFNPLSERLITFYSKGGNGDLPDSLYVFRCPMAFSFKGAKWLQSKKGTENPYFGSSMFSCGTIVDTIEPSTDKTEEGE